MIKIEEQVRLSSFYFMRVCKCVQDRVPAEGIRSPGAECQVVEACVR